MQHIQLEVKYLIILIDEDNPTDKSIQSTSLEIELPLSLFLRVGHEDKDAKNKITLVTNKDPVALSKVFADLTENFVDSETVKVKPNIIGFVYPNKAEVTIIVAKTKGIYRIQSSHYEALLFITHQIVLRLNEVFQYDVSCFIEDEIHSNLTKYFDFIENHFRIFQNKKLINGELEKYTSLYTRVQKSLLNKYKVIYKLFYINISVGKKSSSFEQLRLPS
jgi:hypothetical protein